MSRANWGLLAAAGLLTLWIVIFETAPPEWERAGRVFPDLETGDVTGLEIRRLSAPQGGDSVIELRYGETPAAWWIDRPFRFPAFHPRVMGIVYEIADLTRVAEAPEAAASFPAEPEIRVLVRTRRGRELLVEVGRDHPDPSLDFVYVRVAGEVFVVPKEFRRQLAVTLDELRSRALFPVAPSDAMSLEVTGEGGVAKTIVRDGESSRWRLRVPLDALADRELTEALLSDMNSWKVLEFENDAARTQEDLQRYGLAVPRAIVRVAHRDGRVFALEIGAEFRSLEALLVHVRPSGQAHVFSADAAIVPRILEDPESYRSRFVFDLGLEDIRALRCESAGAAFRVKLEDSTPSPSARGSASQEDKAGAGRPEAPPRWVVIDERDGNPVAADSFRVQTLFAHLKSLLVQKFVAGDVPLATLGLETPWARAVLTQSDGRDLELSLGSRSKEEEYAGLDVGYASRPGEPGAYLVGTRLWSLIEEGAPSLWKRDISLLDPDGLLAFEVRDGDRSWTLARVPREPWGLSTDTPILEERVLDQAAIQRLVSSLGASAFRVQDFTQAPLDLEKEGLELSAPRRGVLFVAPQDLPGFRKILLGNAVEGSVPRVCRARVDIPSLPPFTLLEAEVPKAFEALVEHLRAVTES